MADAAFAVQTAIHARLTGDATLMATLDAVHDQVPENAAFPYLTIGEDTASDFGTKTEQGQSLTLSLHAWSRAHGRRQVKDILARVHALLHEQALTVAGFTHVMTRFEFTQTFRDPDGLTQHGVARYRVVVQG